MNISKDQINEVQEKMWEALKNEYLFYNDKVANLRDAVYDDDEKDLKIRELNNAEKDLTRIIMAIGAYHKDLAGFEARRQEIEVSNKAEKKKRKTAIEVERQKSKIPWTFRAFDIVKIALPIILGSVTYGIAQKRLLKFEEEGHLTTSAGKDLHLPKM